MLVLADLAARRTNIVDAIAQLRQNPETSHLPIIGFAEEKDAAVQAAARTAGATLVCDRNGSHDALGAIPRTSPAGGLSSVKWLQG